VTIGFLHLFYHLMWHKHISAALAVSFLIGGGIWLLIFAWSELQTARRLEKSSAVVEGRVISSSTQKLSKGGQYSTLVVEYTPAGHPPVTRKFAVNSDDYTAAQSTGKARVTYAPEAPQISRVRTKSFCSSATSHGSAAPKACPIRAWGFQPQEPGTTQGEC